MSTIWTICSLWFGLSVPLVPLGNMLAPDQLDPVLVETGSWPHHFFTPRGLACHPDLGPILLVAERYGVLELRMDAIDNEPPVPHPQPDVARCLRNDLDFAAGGLSSISLECYPRLRIPWHRAVSHPGRSLEASAVSCWSALLEKVPCAVHWCTMVICHQPLASSRHTTLMGQHRRT